MKDRTIHACAVAIDGVGVLIRGSSGYGKTSLALGLIERSQARFGNAAMVADDRVILEHRDAELYALPPNRLAGKVELRGFGIVDVDHLNETRLDLVVELSPDAKIQRMPPPALITIEGCQLPFLNVPRRHEALAARIVMAWLQENKQ